MQNVGRIDTTLTKSTSSLHGTEFSEWNGVWCTVVSLTGVTSVVFSLALTGAGNLQGTSES